MEEGAINKRQDQELEQILVVSEESSSCKDFENETNRRERTLDEYRAQCGQLLKRWTQKDLELMTTRQGVTVLHFAAQSRILEIVKINDKPPYFCDSEGRKPNSPTINMVSYQFSVTLLQELTLEKRAELLFHTIDYDLFDLALKILEMDPNQKTIDTECCWKALEELARKPSAIGSESQLPFWKSRLNSWFKRIFKKALTKTLGHRLVKALWKMADGIPDKQFSSNLNHLIFEAAKAGNVEFLNIFIRYYPGLIGQRDENNMSIFHIAILYRQESVFSLIYEIGTKKDTIASDVTSGTNENMLHLAARLAPLNRLNILSGVALQMQRELLWFKEIEKIVPLSYVKEKNSSGQTPMEIFIKTHAKLREDGEKWMKDTANYCMLVATLIATVIFAAAFTLPGGNNQETGTPIFWRSNWFMVFFISDAVALCSSSTSIVIFLSILTSRYMEEDFQSLPSKLAFGLATLYISIAAMMVSFSATFLLVYNSRRVWAPVIVITSTSIPVSSFVLLHRKLLVDTFLSTYKSSFLFRPYKHRFF